MKPKELKEFLSPYAALLLYSIGEDQRKDKLPYSNPNAFHQYTSKGTRVTPRRLAAIAANVDHHIKELQALKDRINRLESNPDLLTD